MSIIPLTALSKHVVLAYDKVIGPHRNYCPLDGLPSEKPGTLSGFVDRWIFQLSGARGVDNGGVRAQEV